jgi:anti-anti-sigma regulatory factor
MRIKASVLFLHNAGEKEWGSEEGGLAVRQTSKEIMDLMHLTGFNLFSNLISDRLRYFV